MKYGTEQRKSLLFAPTQPLAEQERPICHRSAQCKDCPHAGHGFICWHGDDSCMRTDIEKIEEREKKDDISGNHDESGTSSLRSHQNAISCSTGAV